MSRLHRLKKALGRLKQAVALVLKATPGWSALLGLCLAAQALLPIAVLYATKLLVDHLMSLSGGGADGIGNHHALPWLIGAIAVLVWMMAGMRSVTAYVTEAQSQRVSAYVQQMIWRKAVAMDLSYYENPAYFDSLHVAQQEAPYRPVRIVSSLATIVQGFISVAAVGMVMVISLNPFILCGAALLLVPGFFLRLRMVRSQYDSQKARATEERKLQYVNWLLADASIAKEIKLFDLGQHFIGLGSSIRRHLDKSKLAHQGQRMRGELITQVFLSAGVCLLLASLVGGVTSGVISLGTLVLNFQALQRGVSSSQDMVSGFTQIYEHGLFLGHQETFMNLQPKLAVPATPAPLPPVIKQGLEFDHVEFRYQGQERSVLKDVSFTVRPGEMVLLVGDNGAGKSTLIKLLCRLYDPDGGSIRLDGTDLRHFSPEELRRRIAVMFQDFVHYYASASENIAYGDIQADGKTSDVRRAAEQGGAHDFIMQLPGGYEQMLGHAFIGGTELSLGQWQKIALSRAFYREASIIVLDEPTSALDVESERAVLAKFRELTRGKISFVISHRLSTARAADRVLYLKDGVILEAGTHDSLMRSGGAYASIFATQAGSYL